jgi:hypothetical protein
VVNTRGVETIGEGGELGLYVLQQGSELGYGGGGGPAGKRFVCERLGMKEEVNDKGANTGVGTECMHWRWQAAVHEAGCVPAEPSPYVFLQVLSP